MPADGELEEILSCPALHAEARHVAPALAQLAAGCGPEAVRMALQPLVLVYGIGEATKSPAFWGVYFRNLADLPSEALAKGVEEYASLPDSHFFPKPGPLRALAMKHAEPIFKAATRAKRAADSLPRRPVDKGDAESRKRLVADVLSTLSIRRVQPGVNEDVA